ncbi:phosphatidylinositol 3,4,5-trisphosphate 3-phosphatase TPTE2 isoform X1 [Theropithecus gelada]|uniref:phosphatidylinositol 3,4,5-trisphosphate 3-phosphatase TPTE2 isoform X1 n=1 Tax=Theropithecus gelada TaxID=9565 RepID=UPI000DC19D88|nr:phosphatidylinositol 3,4,5-trisphosphate 3-phosphatase TPTE2 isoform X1 [Theropithecus gelada]
MYSVMKASFSRKVNLELCLLSDCALLSSSSAPTNELSDTNLEARINESPDPNALEGVIIDRSPSDSTQTNEFKGASKETLTIETPHSSERKGAALLSPVSKSMLERLSKFEVEDAENVASHDTKLKKIVRSIVSSFAFGIFGVFLVLLDVTLLLADLIFNDSKLYIPLVYRSISLAIALFFLMDVLLRVFVEGWIHLVRLLRLIILIRIFHLIHQKRQLEKLMRRLVSENKRRYTRDGFDLDLTYVTERIIAMSFPSSGRQSFYRNPIEEVVRFLDKKHPNHYRVYNLCSERAYDPKYFHNRVSRIMIDDHNVPTLHEMVVFTKEVNEWMAQDPANIVAIHCKGGKGRTGTMICAFLIASEIFLTAEESLYYFGERRTDKTNSSKFQGVETPSQNRYVGYFAQVKHLHNWNLPPRRMLCIKRFIIYSIRGGVCDLKVQIVMEKKVVFSSTSLGNCSILHDIETDRVLIDVFNGPPLYDDVKVQFFSSNLPKYYDNCPFFFWFNTSFIQSNRLYLPRNELDNPHKQKTWKIYPPQFAVEVLFGEK